MGGEEIASLRHPSVSYPPSPQTSPLPLGVLYMCPACCTGQGHGPPAPSRVPSIGCRAGILTEA